MFLNIFIYKLRLTTIRRLKIQKIYASILNGNGKCSFSRRKTTFIIQYICIKVFIISKIKRVTYIDKVINGPSTIQNVSP